MSLQIEDGKGRGNIAAVNSRQRLLTIGNINTGSHYASLEDGRCFNVVSEDDDAAAGDFILYIKNDSTERLLIVDVVRVQAENAVTWKVWQVTGTATGGTTLTPKNMNLGSGISAVGTFLGNSAVGGLSTDGEMIAPARTPANTSLNIPFDDTLILGTNDAIAIEYDTGTTGDAEVLARIYYRKPDEDT